MDFEAPAERSLGSLPGLAPHADVLKDSSRVPVPQGKEHVTRLHVQRPSSGEGRVGLQRSFSLLKVEIRDLGF